MSIAATSAVTATGLIYRGCVVTITSVGPVTLSAIYSFGAAASAAIRLVGRSASMLLQGWTRSMKLTGRADQLELDE